MTRWLLVLLVVSSACSAPVRMVHIDSVPSGAEVVQILDNEPIKLGTTPLKLPPFDGTRNLIFRKDDLGQQVPLRKGQTKLIVSLIPMQRWVLVQSIPPGATVSLNPNEPGGGYRGLTPYKLRIDTRTSHRIRIERPGFNVHDVDITPGQQDSEVMVRLVPSGVRGVLALYGTWIAVASCIVLALVGGAVFILLRPPRSSEVVTADTAVDSTLLGGKYRLKEPIGEGAFATVYRAVHIEYREDCAVKWFHHKSGPTTSRVLQEVAVGRDLRHPNITRVYGFGEHEQRAYIVMEYLAGRTLAETTRQGALPVDQAIGIAMQICEGLGAAHERGVIHRDLKPENIMLLTDGTVKILDFGVAKVLSDNDRVTQTGMALGTPLYMSPEHLNARDVDGRGDLYSLGAMLYEMLCGQPPFVAPDAASIMAAQLYQTPEDVREKAPHVPLRLAEVVQKLLAKAPDDRYPDARTVKRLLDHIRKTSRR